MTDRNALPAAAAPFGSAIDRVSGYRLVFVGPLAATASLTMMTTGPISSRDGRLTVALVRTVSTA